MELQVFLFAGLREAAGTRTLTVSLPAGASVSTLRARLGETHPALAPLLARAAVAVNQEYAEGEQRLAPGDEVALIPPVSGGSRCI